MNDHHNTAIAILEHLITLARNGTTNATVTIGNVTGSIGDTQPEVVRLLHEIRGQNVHIQQGVTMAVEAVQRIQNDIARISVDIDLIKQKFVDVANASTDTAVQAAVAPLADGVDAATAALDQIAGAAAVAAAEAAAGTGTGTGTGSTGGSGSTGG
jgi:hypothetical protein